MPTALDLTEADLTPAQMAQKGEASAEGSFSRGGQLRRAFLENQANLVNKDTVLAQAAAARKAKKRQLAADLIMAAGTIAGGGIGGAAAGTLAGAATGASLGGTAGGLLGSAVTGQRPSPALSVIPNALQAASDVSVAHSARDMANEATARNRRIPTEDLTGDFGESDPGLGLRSAWKKRGGY